ncbi:hypothetical protein KAS79_03510 [Candidatus Parcubacteria bacterium]|nr:hypothetical protein [Candidatus Parcubacteria bacterium]
MAKKIFDIIPPKEEVSLRENIKTKTKKPRKKSGKRRAVFVLIGLFVFLFVIFANFVFIEFNFEIWPETEAISFEEKIIIGQEGVISGEIIEEEKEIWQEFSSTGKVLKEKKAGGRIQVYNACNPVESLTLRAGTRFLSDSGKYFYSPERIYIPAAKIEKGKVVPSFVEVEIAAMEPGEESNIKPATFSVPGLVGTSYYYTTYGKSFSDMSGGFKKEVEQVTQEDLDNAKKTLEQKALKDGEISLKDKISSEFILLDKALFQEIGEDFSSVKAGAELETFNFSVKVFSKALIFEESALKDLAKQFVLSRISKSQEIIEESLVLDYSPEEIDIPTGRIILNLKISSEIYQKIDIDVLKNMIKGKSLDEAEFILKAKPEVGEVETNFFPFWAKKVPQDVEKIKIKLNLD